MTDQDQLEITESEEDVTPTLSFPLERTSAMRLLGIMWTGYVSGMILVSALLLIGVLFMGNQGFNLISVFFFFSFILPIAFYLQKRLVNKGRRLMRQWCDIKFIDGTLHFKTGFPNTMNPDWQKIVLEEVEENNRKLILKGEEVGGFHIRINHDEIYRLGLWLSREDANNGARELAKLTKWQIVNETRKAKSV